MRDFIKYEEGKTLQQAIDAWQYAERHPKQKSAIAPQFEYIRHIHAGTSATSAAREKEPTKIIATVR